MNPANEVIIAYERFLKDFLSNVNPDDQLPVRINNSNIGRVEVIGAVIDWILQYLHLWKCPQTMVSPFTKVLVDEIRPSLDPNTCPYFNGQLQEYSALPLMQYVIGVIRNVCQMYLDSDKIASLPVSNSYHYLSTFATKNRRRCMEDSHVIINDLQMLFNIKNCGSVNYYAVFDGHNGIGAALYSATHLHQYLAESQFYPMYPEQALCEAFKATDRHLLEKDNSQLIRSGTTAVCVLWHKTDQMLYVAWAGDSEALLAKRGRVFKLVQPHKGDREDERKRIVAAGGVVLFWQNTWRVNGQLAVSRAIGDQEHKSCIIPNPDVKSIPLDGDEDFVILACDGLWDAVKPEEAAQIVYNHISKSPDDYDEVSQILVQQAKSNRSEDNITVIVVYLSDPHKIKLSNADMETATAESFPTKQNGSTYCTLNNLQSNFDPEDDFGPETNIDDGLLSQPVSTKKTFTSFEALNNGFGQGTPNNSEIGNKGAEIDAADSKNVLSDESDDDEWNFYKGEGNGAAVKTNNHRNSPSAESNSDALQQEMDHKLNPDAAEFVPVCASPISVKSTNLDSDDDDDGDDGEDDGDGDANTSIKFAPEIRQRLLNDEFVASSPLKGQEKSMENVDVPTLNDFDKEIRKRPSNILPTTDVSTSAEASFWNDGDVCPIKQEELSPSQNVTTNDTCMSTNAIFGDDSCISKNMDDVNTALEEQAKETQPSTEQSNYFQDKHTANGAFDKEDYPSIVEKDPTPAAAPATTNSNNSDFGVFASQYDQKLDFSDVSAVNNDPFHTVVQNYLDFTSEDVPTHSTVFVDGQPVFQANRKTPSPVDELIKEAACNKNDNPFAIEKEHDVPVVHDQVDFLNEQPVKTETIASNKALFSFDKQVPPKEELVMSVAHFDNLSNEPASTQEIKTEPEPKPEAQPQPQAEVKLEPEHEPEPEPEPEQPKPSASLQRMLSSQILDADEFIEAERGAYVTSPSHVENSKEPLCTQYDAEAPYIHDCTRLGEKPDSVHPEPIPVKRYADLLPDLETSSTMESDKLASELRESEGKPDFDEFIRSSEEAASTNSISDPFPHVQVEQEEPKSKEVVEETKPAPVVVETPVPSAPSQAELTKTLAPAVDAVIADAKKEVKRSIIKKPPEEKPKASAKPAPKTSATLSKPKPTPTTRTSIDAKKPTSTSSPKAAPARPSVPAARTAAPKSSTTISRTAAAATKAPTTAKPSVSSTTRTTTVPKVASPSKPRLTTTTAKTNGDVSSAKQMTARKMASTSSAAKKTTTETAAVATTAKPSVNLSTRTSLAPSRTKTAATTASPEKAKLSTLTAKRPVSAPTKVTNKRLSETKTSPLKTSASSKTESKVNNGLKSSPVASKPMPIRKPTAATSNQSAVSSEHQT